MIGSDPSYIVTEYNFLVRQDQSAFRGSLVLICTLYCQRLLTHYLIHHFENVPNSKKLRTTTEMWLLKDFKIRTAQKTLWTKVKLLKMSNFTFVHNVYLKFFLHCVKMTIYGGKGYCIGNHLQTAERFRDWSACRDCREPFTNSRKVSRLVHL